MRSWFQRWKLQYADLLSNFAFEFKLCRYKLLFARAANAAVGPDMTYIACRVFDTHFKPWFLELNGILYRGGHYPRDMSSNSC